MKKMNVLKMMAVVALLFTVNMNADAQFGSLKGLANKAKRALKDKAEQTVEQTIDGSSRSSSSSSSSSNNSSSIEQAVKKAAAGDSGELPWTMTREGQNKTMQFIEKMETASQEEVAKLRDDMIKRYLYNEAAKPNDGYTENMYFSNFLQNISNSMGILNHYNVKIIDGRFDFDAQGKVELITFGPSAYVEVNDKGEAYFTSASNHDRTYLNAERLAKAKDNLKRVENYRTFFAAAGKGLSKDMEETFEEGYNRATMYVTFLSDAIKGNSPANITRRAMPKAGSLNGQLHAAALAIAKKRMNNVVDVVITRDQWDVKRNALGQILHRVAYGYYIVKDEVGRKAVSHSWAQDYQGGGKYGSLRHFGVGAEGAFYVK